MSDTDGLICAYRLDGSGGGELLSREAAGLAWTEDDLLWLHFDRDVAPTRAWLDDESGLPRAARETLLAADSRPHCTAIGEGLLLALRGVNMNPGAKPEDMVAIRLWTDGRRIVTSRKRHLMAVDDLRRAVEEGRGPRNAGEFIADLAANLTARIAGVVDDFDDEVDHLEEIAVDGASAELRSELARVRRNAIRLRRYIAPQRDAMGRLIAERPAWIEEEADGRLREIDFRLIRYVEDLDAARERAQVVQDELGNRLSEQMNRNMYVLSLIAAIFLPLGLITGILGMNVAGIPGTGTAWDFLVVCLGLVVIAGLEYVLFKALKWL